MINWKLRLNPTTVAGIVSNIVAFIVMYCGVIGINLPFAETTLTALVTFVVGFILLLFNLVAVIVDPTTEGWDDSAQAMSYTEPKKPEYTNPTPKKTPEELSAFIDKVDSLPTDEAYAEILKAPNPRNSFVLIDDHAMFWGETAPTCASDGDVYINGASTYWRENGQWCLTKSKGAVYVR